MRFIVYLFGYILEGSELELNATSFGLFENLKIFIWFVMFVKINGFIVKFFIVFFW